MTKIWTHFRHVSEKIRLNFEVRNFVGKKLWKKYRLLSFFVPMPCHIHTQPHTESAKRGNPVTVTNSEFQTRTNLAGIR